MRQIPFRGNCTYCLSPVLQLKNSAECNAGCQSFKLIDGKAIVPLNVFTMQELVDLCGNVDDTIEVAGMKYELDCVQDSIGIHPIWQNDKYRIFVTMNNPDGIGGPGLYMDICLQEDGTCLGYPESLVGTIENFETFKILCQQYLNKYFEENVKE
jgi:hypothetical protein